MKVHQGAHRQPNIKKESEPSICLPSLLLSLWLLPCSVLLGYAHFTIAKFLFPQSIQVEWSYLRHRYKLPKGRI